MYGVQLQVGQQLMTARQFEKTGSVINLQARKRNTSPKRKNRKSHVRKTFTIDQKSKPDS
jgi:hypothetical protein